MRSHPVARLGFRSESLARRCAHTPGLAPRMEVVMQAKRTSAPMVKTDTPGVYRRCGSYVAKWVEDGKTTWRTFPTYEAAVAFRRDFVLPFRERKALPPTAIMPKRRDSGWVYFFQSKAGPVKVGWSKDPKGRMATLSTAHPYPLEMVALIPGGEKLEKRLHQAFARYRLDREWFSQEVLDEVRVLLFNGSGSDRGQIDPANRAPGGETIG